MQSITFTGVPTFRIDEVARAKAFYIDYLGFRLDWEHYYAPSAPVYMQVSRGGLVLHLTENERFPPKIIALVITTGLEAFQRELEPKPNGGDPPTMGETPWKTLQLELEDPFGNRLRFNQSAADVEP